MQYPPRELAVSRMHAKPQHAPGSAIAHSPPLGVHVGATGVGVGLGDEDTTMLLDEMIADDEMIELEMISELDAILDTAEEDVDEAELDTDDEAELDTDDEAELDTDDEAELESDDDDSTLDEALLDTEVAKVVALLTALLFTTPPLHRPKPF